MKTKKSLILKEYRKCFEKCFRKPPVCDTVFCLQEEDDTHPELAVEIMVTGIGYTLQCVYNHKVDFSVTDDGFFIAVEKLFSTKRMAELAERSEPTEN